MSALRRHARRARTAAPIALGLALLAFRLDQPPPDPLSLEVRTEDTAAPLFRAPETALFTPAPGAPIIVPPESSFWVDMIVRIPLTPPPGVQQERALNDFAAVATGYADIGARPVVPLPVIKIRPGGQWTHYRAVVEVPAWMAEGVWDLRVEGRGFAHEVTRGLVVRRGPLGVLTATAGSLTTPGRARAAVLSGATVALVPAGLADAPGSVSTAHTGFLAALQGIGLATVVRPSAADRAAGGDSFRRHIAPLLVRGPAIADGAWTEPAAARAVTVADVALEEGALINRGAAPARVVLRVSSDAPSALLIDGQPAAPRTVDLTGSFDAPSVLRTYAVEVPAGGRRRVELVPRPASASMNPVALNLPPQAEVGDAVNIEPRVPGPRPSSSAWSFDDETFAGGERVKHRFTRLGVHTILLVRAGPDGEVAHGKGRLRVDTAVRVGCGVAGGDSGGGGGPILQAAALLCLICLLSRRGNPSRRPNVRSTTG